MSGISPYQGLGNRSKNLVIYLSSFESLTEFMYAGQESLFQATSGGRISTIINGNSQWLPNINIEFILTRDKKLRLIVFNKYSLDLSGTTFGRRNRQGVSISYRKDFETFLGKKEKDIEFKAPADSTGKP